MTSLKHLAATLHAEADSMDEADPDSYSEFEDHGYAEGLRDAAGRIQALADRPIEETMSITSRTGVRFIVRILRPGAKYGASGDLIWGSGLGDHENVGVEFYDTRHPHTDLGQFVGRYFADTLLGRDDYGTAQGGLDLVSYEPSWKIDADAMTLVRAWLRNEIA